ncbi:hypothetical protein B0T21DRAFT_344810 [Apiosordaria backusii]|uniref:BHLH domain-containing protein n=1 Tax=Apiosordaria backusii TaxID=314023 RepID=A0AA40K3T7_9PEZI|nr:hypothetical protein B0T21DRAFT_344810 [Apiosordaria backusii]
MNLNAWGTNPEIDPAQPDVHGLSGCPTTAPEFNLHSPTFVGGGGGWCLPTAPIPTFSGPHPHPVPFGFYHLPVPDDPGGFTTPAAPNIHHPAYQSPGITNHASCATTTTTTTLGQVGNNSSGNGYFAHHDPITPITWAAETATVTGISERSLFSFQHQLHPCDTTIRTSDASPGSSKTGVSPIHSPTFTPSPGGRKHSVLSWSASSCASSPPPPCDKSGDDYFASASTLMAMDDNTNSSIQQPPLQPGSRVIAASPNNFFASQSQTQTLEEYESNRRLWHNQIGKKYRTKLNEQFENLQLVLRLYDEDDEDTDTENVNITVKGRSINKAKLLDMARQKLEDLMNERKAWRQEKKELLENLGLSED